MSKLLYNKEWLTEQYVEQQKSIRHIARGYNCGYGTIRYWLTKYNIQQRMRGEAVHLAKVNHCTVTSKLLETVNGQLLGDACLYAKNQHSARLSWSQQYKEYARYIKDTLTICGIAGGEVCKYKGRTAYYFTTHFYKELFPIRQKWYSYNETLRKYKKRVPRDIELTPITCLHWYLGDGSTSSPKRGKSYIRLSTYDFSIEDVEFLVSKLKDIGFRASRQSYDNQIYISTESAESFLKYIGECPVDCYGYRWACKDDREFLGPDISSNSKSAFQYNLAGKLSIKFNSISETYI